MHPPLDELIALRDGEASAETVAHASACPSCTAEVTRLREMQESLRALPLRSPTRDLWPPAHGVLRPSRRRPWLQVAVVAAFFLVAAGVGLVWQRPAPPPPGAPPSATAEKATPEAAPVAPLAELISQSQLLEQVLEAYRSRSEVMNSRSAGAIADLQDRVALIDLQLAMAEDGVVPESRVAELWQYRVKLLASMVEIHSARGEYTRI